MGKNCEIRNFIGERFDKLLVIKELDRKNNQRKLLCKCDCGNEKIVYANSLTRQINATKNCGCSKFKHGFTRRHHKKHPLFKKWVNIKERCERVNCKSYKDYGGRGIKMCDEWRNSFLSFYNWAINNDYQEHLSIDRINNDGDYEPNNCRWAAQTEQNRNKRNNVFVTFNGKEQTLSQWEQEVGVKQETIRRRLLKGWDIERVFKPNSPNIIHNEKSIIRSDGKIYNSIIEAKNDIGLPSSHIGDVCKGKRNVAGRIWMEIFRLKEVI